ncbi:MAG: 1-deoxy-D-xylulose-5-phosphate synthase [Candidatus Borkfalkiaceae bacterium]|nr:1-deoxy-D-xylulose-5-phosphate synthase [Christensenellaceae bacterium]
MYEILNRINSPADVKKLSIYELNALAEDIREALFNRLTKMGGHFGPNFGIVEAEIAMHYVFSSPKDKFVFDVSHQSYPHKMLTGRKAGYICDAHFKEDSGYTNPDESEHDLFNVGHTSTSISLATGLCKARDVAGGDENVIALIGDGSLSGGEALEGLNVAGSELNSNLIIVINDNQQSISETHGGIYKSLKDLRETGGKSQNNVFKAFGLDYIYEENGNDVSALIKLFKSVKDINHPVAVHINTLKGKGYKFAEQNKEAWHWTVPFDRQTGKPTVNFAGESYTAVAREYILNRAKTDDKFVAVTPNMPGSMALSPDDRIAMGKHFIDVGIAEEQAVAMASGLAKGGLKPLVITNATFMQRAYDQISHDVCINKNHVTILLNYCNFDGLTDVTHLGIFAIPAFSNIPELKVLCPANKKEFLQMLNWSLDKNDGPVMILMPGGITENSIETRDFIVGESGKITYSVEEEGEKVAILALGDFYKKGKEFADKIKAELGFAPTLVNVRTPSESDEKTLESLKKNHEFIITLEDGVLSGGFGQKISSYYGTSDIKIKNYGLEKKFYDRYNPSELLNELKITPQGVIEEIKKVLG